MGAAFLYVSCLALQPAFHGVRIRMKLRHTIICHFFRMGIATARRLYVQILIQQNALRGHRVEQEPDAHDMGAYPAQAPVTVPATCCMTLAENIAGKYTSL